MKKNYQIKFNQSEPSSEQINRHKDFDALLKSFEQQHPPKKETSIVRRLVWWSGAIAAAVIGVVFWFNQATIEIEERYFEQQTAYFQERPFVNPPFENIRPTFTSYQVNAVAGGDYSYGENSRIVIPEAAFQDDNGQTISGEVNLFYREMHDPVDFFLSGIPLTYDSASVNYTLESAGMIEIYAEQDGRRVRMAHGKSIDIELATEISLPFLNVPPQYNIYKLDTEARNWVYQELNRMSVLTSADQNTNPVVQAYESKLKEITLLEEAAIANLEASIPEPISPLKPRQRNSDLPSLELDFLDSFGNSEEAKAIRDQYEGAIWQLSPKSDPIPADAASENWEDFEMKEITAGEYTLTLIKEDRRLNLVVQPVLLDGAYAKAIEQYEEELLAYEQGLASKEAALAEERTAIQNKFAAQKNELRATILAENETYVNAAPTQKRKVVNRFRASSFGIWNCDRPIAPDPQKVVLSFKDQFGDRYENQTAYLLDKNRNSVEQILVTKNTVLEFDTNSNHFLWIVKNENQIAVMRPADFKNLQLNTKRQKVQLELLDQKIENEKDVRKMIEL